MLKGLSVRNIVLIERLDITFGGGLSVLTGETGAGKSILLDALGLSIGARADAGLVRASSSQASVSATFQVAAGHAAYDILAESEIDDEDDVIILRRTLGLDGRSRAYVNDQPVSISMLRKLGESLLEVHGQFDGRGLMDRSSHRVALDIFGGLNELTENVRAIYGVWREAVSALVAAESNAQTIKLENAELRETMEELSALAPELGEEVVLSDKRQILLHAEQLIEALDGSIGELDGEGMASERLRAAQRRLERVAPKAMGGLNDAMAALERAQLETAEALRELQMVAADIEGGGAELSAIEDRLFALRDVARKYSVDADDLPIYLEKVRARLEELSGDGDPILAAREAEAAARKAFVRMASELSVRRRTAAKRLDKTVGSELPPLKMEKAVFKTAVETLDEQGWNEHGCDRIEFRIATNPGNAPGPLSSIASGGELARFMLALKIALVGVGTAETLIFDEVDSGIGGATADAVGERLGHLGAHKQVLVVTHSPQVAARGDQHLHVEKHSTTASTKTVVSCLGPEARREEVARMLAGRLVTDEARGAAERLIQREGV
ncbi:MAG: DNA repair protein RecN [Pseudomonadota bacterium]|nr:DNA repair protein RecN [Pseudomonadota bacterium]